MQVGPCICALEPPLEPSFVVQTTQEKYSFFETLHCQPLDMANLPVSVKLSWNGASSDMVNKSYG